MIRNINGGYSNKELIGFINKFPDSRILVIGDIIDEDSLIRAGKRSENCN